MKIKIYIQIVFLASVILLGKAETYAQDITAQGGTLTVYQENGGGSGAGEGSPMVIDNDITTKFLSPYDGLQWMQFQLNAPAVVGIYTLTSANDAAGRDPKDWTFEGSVNGTDWVVLDTRTGETFSSRLQTVAYEIDNTEAFEYYRVHITANNGDGLFQLSEWRLKEAATPEAPSDLTAISTAGDEIILSWRDNSAIEKGFELEQSTDNINFEKIADLETDVSGFTQNLLEPGTTYYYRVRSFNSVGGSEYSNVAEVTTIDQPGAPWDITDNGGVLTVSDENANENENSPKLIDNDYTTKYLIPVPIFSVQYESTTTSEVVTKYALVSANDAPSRDPRDWTFEGSNDGESWTVLDTRTGETFGGRYQRRVFAIENTETFQYFKLDVTANNGSSIAQIGEWEILGIPVNAPAVPQNLTTTEVTESTVTLSWDDEATNESGYEIYRSLDGLNFSMVGSTDANESSFTDAEVKVLTTYYYRVKAISEEGNSILSSAVTADIPYDENLPLPAEDLSALAFSETSVELTWFDRAENETGYEIERSRDGETFAVIASLGADVDEYEDSELIMATEYFYRVRPFNDYSQNSTQEVPYTDVASVITMGTNQAPFMNPIDDELSCNFVDSYTIEVTGLTPGPEDYQTLTLLITSDYPDMFSDLSASPVQDGKATITYSLNAEETGTANVTVTVRDNGGTLNGGTDSYSDSFTITSYNLEVEITSYYTEEKVTRGEVIELTASGSGDYDFIWSEEGPGIISDLESSTVRIKPNQNHSYLVTASTDEGCVQDAEFLVQMEGSPYMVEPHNILTPNGDLRNDTWVIWNITTYPENVVKVYDANGRVVFEDQDYNNDWDGTVHGSILTTGSYYYVINLGTGIPVVTGSLTILK